MMPQGKAPAIFQHNSFQNGIALIFVHCTSFPGIRATSGQSVQKSRAKDVDSIRAKQGQAVETHGLPRKRPRKAL